MFKQKIHSLPQISTASLPDIVFLLLFFFMVSSVIKTSQDLVAYEVPKARQLTRAEKKIVIQEMIIGYSKDKALGQSPRIIVNQTPVDVASIAQWSHQARNELPEYLRSQMIILLKADRNVEMGLIADIQQQLRKAGARRIIYEALEE